jgi:hypothetical protein
MSVMDLFWQLNVSDETKYLFMFFIIICVFAICFYNKKNKNKNKLKKRKRYNPNYNDDYYNQYMKRGKLTKCHRNYVNCVDNNIKNNTNEFCYPCLNDGVKQDFFYDPVSKEWLSKHYD